MTYGDTLRTIRMRPVAGVGQACRIIPLPGDGDVILEGPADILDIVRLVRFPPGDGDPRCGGGTLELPDGSAIDFRREATYDAVEMDWLRVLLLEHFGTPPSARGDAPT